MTDIETETNAVLAVLRLHDDPQLLATPDGPLLRCRCTGWAEHYDSPDEAKEAHRRHLADRAVKHLRGWPV